MEHWERTAARSEQESRVGGLGAGVTPVRSLWGALSWAVFFVGGGLLLRFIPRDYLWFIGTFFLYSILLLAMLAAALVAWWCVATWRRADRTRDRWRPLSIVVLAFVIGLMLAATRPSGYAEAAGHWARNRSLYEQVVADVQSERLAEGPHPLPQELDHLSRGGTIEVVRVGSSWAVVFYTALYVVDNADGIVFWPKPTFPLGIEALGYTAVWEASRIAPNWWFVRMT